MDDTGSNLLHVFQANIHKASSNLTLLSTINQVQIAGYCEAVMHIVKINELNFS